MALNIYRYGQSGNMGGRVFAAYSESRGIAVKSLTAYIQIVYAFQSFAFDLCYIFVRII